MISLTFGQEEERELNEKEWTAGKVRATARQAVTNHLQAQKQTLEEAKKRNKRVSITIEYLKAFDRDSILKLNQDRLDEERRAAEEKEARKRERERTREQKERERQQRKLRNIERKRNAAEKKEELKRKRDAEKREKEREMEMRTCRVEVDGERCKRRYYPNRPTAFLWCEHCIDEPDAFGICPTHAKKGSPIRKIIDEHERNCPHRKRQRKRVRGRLASDERVTKRRKTKL